MAPDPSNPSAATHNAEGMLRPLLGMMSVFTLVMTIPQVVTIWFSHQAAGVSILSWGAYLLSAILWFWFGLGKHDKNVYLPCVGWIALDLAIIAGAIVYR
ncbi:MAG TPA: hypothetical protein VGK54_03825 [Chloroflexota bacterium]